MKSRIFGLAWALAIVLLAAGPLSGCTKSPLAPQSGDTITYLVVGNAATTTANVQYSTPNNVGIVTAAGLPWTSPTLSGYATFTNQKPGLTVTVTAGCVTLSILSNASVLKQTSGCGTPLTISLSL